MNVSCEICKVNMNLIDSLNTTGKDTFRSEYFCTKCNHSITIIDDPDENTKLIRELQLKVRNFEMEETEVEISDIKKIFSKSEINAYAPRLMETELGKPRCLYLIWENDNFVQCPREKKHNGECEDGT